MKKIKYYEISGGKTLNDMVNIALRYQQNTKENIKSLDISPKDQRYDDPLKLELNLYLYKGKINSLEIRLNQNTNINNVNSSNLVFDTLKQFGGERYVSVTIREDEDKAIPEDKYHLTISALGYPLCRTKILEVESPEGINQQEVNKFIPILNTLKVPYEIKGNILKIHSFNGREKISIESQVIAYQQIIGIGLSPWIHSSGLGWGHAIISENKMKSLVNDEITRRKSFDVKKASYNLGLKEKDISLMQMFVEKNFEFKFNEKRTWEISYYLDYLKSEEQENKYVIKISD